MKRPIGKFLPDTFLARKTTAKFANVDLTGKQVVFTGGTDGIGRVAVERFAEMGADLCLLGRNMLKTENVVKELKQGGYKGKFTIIKCDLGNMAQVRSAANRVVSECPRIDYLINCAGLNFAKHAVTVDGFEMNFAVNYLGPFLLTELLLEPIKATRNSRIIHLTSATQEVAKLYLDDLQHEHHPWSTLNSYAQAKLCLQMHGRDVADRLAGSGTTINCLNPGYIKSNIGRHVTGMERMFNLVFGGLAAPTWVGAERVVMAALSDEYRDVSGQFIYEDMLLQPNRLALDDVNVANLMDISRRYVGIADIDSIQRVS